MKLFDDIFRRNVEKAFSNYNAEHLADEGWNSFFARKAARRRRAVIIFWARAASIALIVGISTLIGYLTIIPKPDEDKTAPPVTESKKELHVDELPVTIKSGSPVPALPPAANISGQSKEKSVEKPASFLPSDAVPEQPAGTRQQFELVTPVHIYAPFLPQVAESRYLMSDDSLNQAAERAIIKLNAGGSDAAPALPEETGKLTGRTRFMAGLSGLVTNVGNAASTSPGMSAGFYLEQKITKRISLRPGLALAMNSLGIDNSMAAAYSLPLINGVSGTPASFKGQLNLLAMEVPLNIVFKVYDKGRSGISLSAGTSTLIYFSQQFTGDFVNSYTQAMYDSATGKMNSETRYSTVSVKSSYGTLRRADFFGLASFSAGYSLPYGQTGAILIEPFIQLPVRELTALDLRVRYGGMSVKISFGARNGEK